MSVSNPSKKVLFLKQFLRSLTLFTIPCCSIFKLKYLFTLYKHFGRLSVNVTLQWYLRYEKFLPLGDLASELVNAPIVLTTKFSWCIIPCNIFIVLTNNCCLISGWPSRGPSSQVCVRKGTCQIRRTALFHCTLPYWPWRIITALNMPANDISTIFYGILIWSTVHNLLPSGRS